ncbi:hypothetical protein [Streptomyces sp. APSN-46.1]|nr:hypothetical protein [Streptomyces sp. APSN-46.1]
MATGLQLLVGCALAWPDLAVARPDRPDSLAVSPSVAASDLGLA